jgi:hypothetical protein
MASDRYNTGDQEDLVATLARLERRVSVLENNPQLGNATIDRGKLQVVQPDGTVVFEAGEVNLGIGPGTWGVASRRANGTFAFYVYSTDAGEGFWAFKDKFGNIIASEDGASGEGLATPWIPFPGWVINSTTVPAGGEVTTSASFVGIYNTRIIKQHPKVHIEILVRSTGGGTTGEVRVWNHSFGGQQVGATITVTDGMYQRHIVTATIEGDHKQNMELEVQARRTAGAGTIGARVMGSYGRQT